MKEFEKYIQKKYPHITTGDIMFANDVWKAALEWTLRTAKQLEEEQAPILMNDVIQEEING